MSKSIGPSEFSLYDTSDVEIELRQMKSRKEIYLIAKSETNFNLMKFYLALREYVDKIEYELGIMEAADGEH